MLGGIQITRRLIRRFLLSCFPVVTRLVWMPPHPAFDQLLPRGKRIQTAHQEKPVGQELGQRAFESVFSIRADGRDDDGVRLRVHCALLRADLVRRAPCDPRLLGVTAVGYRLQMRVGPAELRLDHQNRLDPLARCRLGFRRPRGSSEAIQRWSVCRHCFCPAS